MMETTSSVAGATQAGSEGSDCHQRSSEKLRARNPGGVTAS
ncbi:hypothetical protein [Nitrosomonas sp.]|nr:hypothetical protein [Nitrosomonas sp.]